MATRVNKSFLVILTVALLGAGLLALLGQRLWPLIHGGGSAQRLEAQGDAALAQNDLEKARDLYGAASAADRTNTAILVKLGDVQHKLTPTDPAYLTMALESWYKAVTLDPRYAPALERLLGSYWEALDLPTSRDDKNLLFSRTREVAEKLLAIQPDNKVAASRKQITLVRQWLEKQTVPQQDLDTAMIAMTELMKKDPSNAELPRYIALVRIRQAEPLADQGQKALAQSTYENIRDMMDHARTAQPDNAAIQYRAFQIYYYLGSAIDPRTKDDPDPVHPQQDLYNSRADKAIAAAQKVVKEDDPLYDEIQVTAAEWLQRNGKQQEAEGIIQDFYKKHPDDQRARLTYGRLLATKPEKRQEAERILAQDLSSKEDVSGFKALVLRDLQGQTLHQLVMMKLADYAAATDPAKKQQINKEMEDAIDKVRRLGSAKSLRVLDLTGRLHLIRNEDVEAVKTLEEAMSQMPPDRPDYEVMTLLANAYIKTGQPGAAKGLLQRVVSGLPASSTWTAPRLALARLLLQEGDVANAKQQLDRLHQQKVTGQEMTDLENTFNVMASRQDPRVGAEGYAKLPEETREQRQRKAQVAVVLNKPDEAIRILRLIVSSEPKESRAWQGMSAVYEMRGQRDRAASVLKEALTFNPDDPALKGMLLRLTESNPQRFYDEAKKLVEANKDEFLRELQWYDLERGPGGHADQALPHLERALQLKPNDLKVLDLLYQNYVQRKQWDKADPVVRRLVELNADQCGGLLYRQRFAMAKGEYPEAETLGQKLVDQYGEFAASWLALAQAQAARGEFASAANSYSEVRKKQPTQYEALRGLVECYYQLPGPDNLEKAKLLLREGRQKFPDDIPIREMFLNHLVNFENPADAIPDRKKLLDEHPDDASYYLALAATYFHAAQHVAATDRVQSNQRLSDAFNTLNTGRERFPDDARFYGQMAEMYQYANKLDEALRVLGEFAKREAVRDTPQPYLLLADLWARARDWPRLEAALSDALVHADASDNKLDIRLRLVSAMVQNKKYNEAIATLDGAGAMDDPRVVRQRIEVLIAAGDLPKAQEAATKALAKQNSADIRNLLASVLIDTGHVGDAQQQLVQAQQIDPRNSITRYLHALSLAKQPTPDVDGAIKELIDLREQDPRNAQVRLLLAELYRNTGRADYAVRELTDGLQRTPLSKEMRLQLVDLLRSQHPPDLETALKLVKEAEIDPVLRGDIDWYRREVVIWMMEKKPEQAVPVMMQQVIARDPNNLEYRRELLDMLLQFNDYDAVLRESDILLKAGKDAWWLRHQRGLAYAKRTPPQVDKALPEFDRAIALCEQANDPATAEFVMRGMAGAVRPGGEDEAIKRATARLGNDPDNRWHLLDAALYRSKNDWANAIKMVDGMLADPANKPPQRRMPVLRAAADIYQNAPTPNYEKARAAYVELLALQPDDLASLNNLAYLFSESIQPPSPPKAKVYSSKAYEISRFSGSPNDMIYDTHGWVLTLCGGADAAEGLKILEGVVSRRQDFVEGRYHYGVSLMRQTDRPQYKQAVEQLQTALKLLEEQEKAGQTVDPALKDKVQVALSQAKEKAAAKR